MLLYLPPYTDKLTLFPPLTSPLHNQNIRTSLLTSPAMDHFRHFSSMLGLTLIALMAVTVLKVKADALVSGTVFCDQCKDGERSFFDYPLYGARVAVACIGANRRISAYREETTSWMGSYAMRFKGNLNLRTCYARVLRGPPSCGASPGAAHPLNLMFTMFGMHMYGVDPLLLQPQNPMSFCPNRTQTSPTPRFLPPMPITPVMPAPPANSHAPPFSRPQASACSYDKWMMPEYKCYWKLVGPDTKVAIAFGPVAAGKYGTNMTLKEALHGKGDTYRTLLREATAALLNSYNSLQFPYSTISVINHMNWALLGSPQQALRTALMFKRANTGASGNSKCNFKPCT